MKTEESEARKKKKKREEKIMEVKWKLAENEEKKEKDED